jgi:hypothetical protein
MARFDSTSLTPDAGADAARLQFLLKLDERDIRCLGDGDEDIIGGFCSMSASGLIHSDDSQIGRSSPSSHYESRHCRQRHPSRSPPA